MDARDATGAERGRWDRLVETSVNGTLFHRLDFLSYHGQRFAGQERFLVFGTDGNVSAQMPVAIEHRTDGLLCASPYGGSFGGFAVQGYPTYRQASQLASAFRQYLVTEGVHRCSVVPPSAIMADYPLDLLHFALSEVGFAVIGREICNVVPLRSGRPICEWVSSRARNAARKAQKAGVRAEHRAPLADFWTVLEAAYIQRGRNPTHTREELADLSGRLPDDVYFDVAYLEDEPIAAIGHFELNARVSSSFYLAQSPRFREIPALTYLIMVALKRAADAGRSWFDFGTSTAEGVPRPDIFRFKESFGAFGVFRDTLVWTTEG